MKRLILFALFSLIVMNVYSADFYARINGDWHAANTWSTTGPTGVACGCFPGAGDDVYIDGKIVTLTSNNVTIRDLYIYDNSVGPTFGDAKLLVQNSILFNARSVYLSTVNNNSFEIEFVAEDNSITTITDSIYVNRSVGNNEANGLKVRLENSSSIITDDLTFDINGTQDTLIFKDYLRLNSASSLVVNQDIDINHFSGGDFRIFTSGSSHVLVNGNIDIQLDGGTGFRYYASNNSGTEHLKVLGNVTCNELMGGVWIEQRSRAHMLIEGDFIANMQGRFRWLLYNSSRAEILQNFNITQNCTPTQQDINIRLVSNAEFYVGTNGNLANGVNINIINGLDFLFDLRNDGLFHSYGNFVINQQTGRYLRLFLNNSTTATVTGTRWIIDGDLTITKTGAQHMQYYSRESSRTHVKGNFNCSFSTQQNYRYSNFNFEDDAELEVDGNYFFVQNSPFISASNFSLIDNSKFRFHGNTTFHLNSGSTNTNLNMTLNNAANIESGVSTGDLSKTFLFNLQSGNNMVAQINNSASVISYGDVQFLKNGGKDINTNIGSGIGQNAVFNCYQNLIFDNNENQDSISVNLQSACELVVGNNADMTGLNGVNRGAINLFDTSSVSIAGNFLRNASPNQFGKLIARDHSFVRYVGTGNQIIAEDYGDGTDEFHYQSIELNNTFGTYPQLSLEGKITIRDSMVFNDGVVTSGGFETEFLDDAVSFGAKNASYIEGLVRKTGDDAFMFPVGSNQFYLPAGISAPSDPLSEFTAVHINTNSNWSYSHGLREPTIDFLSLCDYWLIGRDVGTDAVQVTLGWQVAHCNDPVVANVKVAQWDGALWRDKGQSITTSTVTEGIVTSAIASTVFGPDPTPTVSPFALASTLTPLPIFLVEFTGEALESSTLLRWETASETNNKHFTLMHSTDGVNFNQIHIEPGAGNSGVAISYQHTHLNPEPGVNYYELLQTDFDGTTRSQGIIAVTFDGTSILPGFPNPVPKGYVLDLNLSNQDYQISLISVNGQIVKSSWNSMRFDGLETGTYMLMVHSEKEVLAIEKIILE